MDGQNFGPTFGHPCFVPISSETMSETVKKHEVQSSLRLGSHQLTMLPFFFGRLDALEVWEKYDGWRRNAVKPQMAWDIYGVFPKIRKNL